MYEVRLRTPNGCTKLTAHKRTQTIPTFLHEQVENENDKWGQIFQKFIYLPSLWVSGKTQVDMPLWLKSASPADSPPTDCLLQHLLSTAYGRSKCNDTPASCKYFYTEDTTGAQRNVKVHKQTKMKWKIPPKLKGFLTKHNSSREGGWWWWVWWVNQHAWVGGGWMRTEGKHHLEYLAVDESMILKWIFK
jgi:hypothetical protein